MPRGTEPASSGARATRSPWQTALGEGFDRLAPGLREYFGALPAGAVGVGEGVFERVGTPRRWLWPALAVAAALGIVWPRWEREVGFAVANRLEGDVLRGRRTFRFRGGDRMMIDAVTAEEGRIVDRLGRGGLLRCRFVPRVDGHGDLVLRSDRVRFLGVPLPVSVRLRERRRAGDPRQRVEFTVDAPLLGRVYEYAGEFDYRVEGGG